MVMLKTFVFAGLLAVAMSQDTLPSFVWLADRKSDGGVPVLAIKFPNGETDHALLTPFNPIPLQPGEDPDSVDNCIFNGNLEKETTATITVTGGCPLKDKNFEIQLRSDRLTHSAFKLVDGKVEIVKSAFCSGEGCGVDKMVQPPEK